jgi:hypothetical protein
LKKYYQYYTFLFITLHDKGTAMLKYVLLVSMLLTRLSLLAEVSQGELLEEQAWKLVKNHKWDDLDNIIAPYFQLALFDEILNKKQYLNHAKRLNISDYAFNDFKVTEGPGVLVVTYNVTVSETIEGTPITSKANRLSVWQKNNTNWQMIAHALLIPVLPPASSAKSEPGK